jgi:hypothetical protein
VLARWGPGGFASDALIGAFLIGFFTLLLVIPDGRREARSGRVRGGGRTARWLRWPARRPVGFALGGGLAVAVVLGGAAVASWSAGGVEQLPRDEYIWIKAGMSAVIGVIVSVTAARIGMAPEPDVSRDPRWLRGAAAGAPASDPCQYLDKGGLAVTDRARGCSATPTWHLVVRGALEPAHVRAALADVLVRYPSLASRVRALDGVPPYARRFAYVQDPGLTAGALFAHHELRGRPDPAGELDALIREHHDRYLDPYADAPISLTLVRTGDDACHLLFRQHHAIADGRAFIALLGDFAGYLDAARAGRRPPPEALAPIGRRDELEPLGLSAGRRLGRTVAGLGRLIAGGLGRALRPLTPLRQNRSNDYTGGNRTIHRVVAAAELPRWKAAGARAGASLNSWLTAALLAATRRWHQDLGLPVGRTSASLMMETRPRAPGFRSFANHLATLEVTLPLDRAGDLAALAREVQAQVDAQRRGHAAIKRFLIERALVGALPLDALHKVVFESKRPTRSLDFSNLIALEFPALAGDGWSVDEVLITTPVVPRAGIVLTVIHYRDTVCFNVNYKDSAVSGAEVEAFADHFIRIISEAAGATGPGAPVSTTTASVSTLTGASQVALAMRTA